jgi:hypothetical protein
VIHEDAKATSEEMLASAKKNYGVDEEEKEDLVIEKEKSD